MDFRNKTPQFREKVRDIYSELNSFYNDKKTNKMKLTKRTNLKITKERMEKIKLFEKKLENPIKPIKQPPPDINLLIEDTKRNCLGYHTFLLSNSSANIIPEPISNKFKYQNKKNKNYYTTNNSLVYKRKSEGLSRNYSKVDTLRKEIMNELENNDDKKNHLISSSLNFILTNKSYKDFELTKLNNKYFN